MSQPPVQLAQELLPPERREAVARLPGVASLLEYMLVRDPALRPSLADAAARVRALLDGRAGPLPLYAAPQVPDQGQGPHSGGLATPPHAGGARTPPHQAHLRDHAQQQVLLAPRPPSAGFAGAGAAYSLAEAYLRTLTPVGFGLALGGLDALASADALTASGATHVVLLSAEFEASPAGPGPGPGPGSGFGSSAERLLAGALPNAALLRALAACAAAGVAARVVSLGPLPDGGGPEARGAAVARFLEALPVLLRHVAAACGPGAVRCSSQPGQSPKPCQNPDHAAPASAGSAMPACADEGCGDLCGHGGAWAGLGSGPRGGWAAVGGVARMLAAVGEAGRAARRARAASAGRRRSGRVAPEPAPQQDVGAQRKRGPPGSHPPHAAAQTGGQLQEGRAAQAAHAQSGPGPLAGPAAQAAARDLKPCVAAGGRPRMVLAAAAGYEGAAAAAAAAALMLLARCPAHEALAALAHRHLALQVPALHACACHCLGLLACLRKHLIPQAMML